MSYTLSGEFTNTNPYSVFIALPDEYIDVSSTGSLPKPNDGCEEISLQDESSVINNEGNTTTTNTIVYNLETPDEKYITYFNGKAGFWMPPYSTVKVKLRVYNHTKSININVPDENNFRIIGPAVSSSYDEIDLNNIYPDAKKEGILLSNFRLYVYGKINLDGTNTNAVSLIIPAPIVLKDYSQIHVVKSTDTDKKIWINYYDWLNNFKNIKNNRNDEILKKLNEEFGDFNPMVSDDLSISLKRKYFPAVAFTTESVGSSLDFLYVVYGEDKEDKTLNLPTILD